MTPPTAAVPTALVPTATYRLQLQPDFTFADAEGVVPHLAALGVSHLHLSPVLQAAPGSTHGYDVVDHTRISEELGGEAGLRALSRTARAHGLGLVLDTVPNHMAVPAPEHLSRPLWSVLREGTGSRYARWFDIDWQALDGKLLMPVLGGPLGEVLGELRVEDDKTLGEPVLRYYDHAFPLRPGTESLPLRELLDAQWYRLAHWREARTDLNYRRFFTISDLIAIRVEDPEVFDATHAKLLELLRDGVADGLRIDHPDGLADPAGYLRRLAAATGGRWTVVEKILGHDEQLPAGWACAGTTGYDALDRVDGLFTDPGGVERITACYADFTGQDADRGGAWAPTARRASYKIVTQDLAAEVSRLGRTAARALPGHDPAVLRQAIRELLVRLPVYRPYVVPGESAPAEAVAMLGTAAREAAVPGAEEIRDLALGADAGFAVRFAQVASALHAKSVEDTAFYRWYPLLPLNEVGRDPGHPTTAPDAFHAFCTRLQRDWPTTGTALSTHDTKRSADVRARLAAVSEQPALWRAWLRRESDHLRAYFTRAGIPLVDRHTEYLAWQYAVVYCSYGAEDVVAATMLKSEREAGLRTSWTEQDPAYEKRLDTFTRELITGPTYYATADIARAIESPSLVNRLGATLLHLTMPGVPDVYQGDEHPQLLLVDPDNRRPYRPAGRLDGPKELVTTTALRLRREHPGWFGADATYEPLYAAGPASGHCVAFIRTGRSLTAVTRLPHGLEQAGGWRGTELTLPPGDWADRLTGVHHRGTVAVADLFAAHPVALLTS
ncbi:malto-oligosyltrehalose synthase [Streptomyces sp. H10-C2]|uniref:malto-oligosyltrehalose synthase n=1 Tax=unclassified Streptomyces TaxID=2593676 RepID=UPI0024BA0E1E|nr:MULTISPECIES: malto-oligosyltrehalose synthase [unclassified Streptomyces]MDJ0340696.1 malto-oligosyltrehalose synthase [Streptomyces sp. PH10-H1]MDJ0372032.1 malto-oligosyltrehalose synthase [Streptomyces sp. H10-C2]